MDRSHGQSFGINEYVQWVLITTELILVVRRCAGGSNPGVCLQYIARVDVEFLCDQGASTTGVYADSKGTPSSLRIRKTINRFCESARIATRARLIPSSLPRKSRGIFDGCRWTNPLRSFAFTRRGKISFASSWIPRWFESDGVFGKVHHEY
jgi:hypothetical protein